MMTPVTVELQRHYRELDLPVAIIAGGADQIADVGRQSQRLHDELPNSTLIVVPGMGHMIHHLAPERVVEAVEMASKRSWATAA
jgi:pimeloyl-ACP methyl ester carboxylesterase